MLGEALRLIRVFHDLKQNELARQLGVSQSHLSDIERGEKTPSLKSWWQSTRTSVRLASKLDLVL